jgi:hypothetical protein
VVLPASLDSAAKSPLTLKIELRMDFWKIFLPLIRNFHAALYRSHVNDRPIRLKNIVKQAVSGLFAVNFLFL